MSLVTRLTACIGRRYNSTLAPLSSSVPPVGYGSALRFYRQPETFNDYQRLWQRHCASVIKSLQSFGTNYNW